MEKVLKLYKYVDGVNDTKFPNEEEQVVVSSFRYDAKRMGGAPLISCTVMHNLCLDKLWTGNVYATFNGERFFVKQVPTSSYDNTDARYKHELELVSERILLDNVYFYDVVDSGSIDDKPVSHSSKFTFFGDIHEFVERLNQSLNYSKVEYSVVVDNDISSEAKMLSFQDQFFSNVLQEIYNTYEIPYYFVGKVIHIGFTENAITHTLKYGQNESLLSIQKQNANYKIVNRVTGVGSTDNIPYYYPNDYESKEEVESNGGTWVNPQTNLMPSIYRESFGDKRFYNALNDTYKIPNSDEYYEFANPYSEGRPKEHIVNFDDIKPTIKGIVNASGYRIDMFQDFAYDLDDNDKTDEEGKCLHPYFFAKLRKFDGEHGFNLFEHSIDEEEMTVSMTSGSCGACEFIIGVDDESQKNLVQVDERGNLLRDEQGNVRCGREGMQKEEPQDAQNDTRNNEVWVALKKDVNTFGVIMPNATSSYKPSVNDTFVILHIDLPKSYILAAEDKLKEELVKYMAMNNSEKFNFSISFSRIFFAENPTILAKLNENARIQLEYDNTTYELYVSSYSYAMSNDKPLPEIRVELSDTLTISQNALQTAISEVKQDVLSSVGSIDVLKQGLKYFLRKDKPDTAKEKITFGKGLDTLNFSSGLFGHGAKVDENGQAELESLFIRTFLEVPELRHNRVTVRMGDEINSVSAGVIESVTPDKDTDGNILTTGTLTLKLEDTDIGTLEYDDIVMQIYSDLLNKENNSDVTSDDGKGNRHMKGFATVMFKVLDVSGERNEIIRYSLRPLSDNWKKQVHPYQFGTFSQRGNFSNKDRQIIVYKGLYPKPYTRYMDGVNDWEFTPPMIGMQLGYLGNLTVNGQEMSGYSAYLNNVYFTGMIRQLYIPQWMDGESSAQNGTLVYMGGDHYVSKGDTNNPPLFDLTDEDGNGLIFTDENGDEWNILDLNSEEYDMLAKKGEDGVGIQSTVFYYMLTAINEKPLEDSEKWGTSLIQPTDLESYLWKKTVVTYTNLTKQVTIECISVRGKDGTSVSIKGSYDTEAELKAAYPNGSADPSDAYIVGGDLYVWNGAEWKNVGAIQGEKGDTAYVHIKYANETTTGTQVTVNGVVVTLSFTANDGEDTGDWMGVYTDHIQADSTNIASYKWKNIKGRNGNDSTSYWLDSPVGVINFTTDGYPSPTSFVVSMKKKKGNGAVESCADFYLATWRYDGNWQLVSTSSVKASSVTIIPAQSTTYKQYRITAHTTASASQSNIVTELGIGVSVNGLKGDKGDDGIFVYDTGLYDNTRAYYYKKMSDGTVRRDKMVYEIGGSFYNYLVRTLTSEDSTGLINTPPTSIDGDENWEVMSPFQSLIANTVFGTNANIGGFMASSEKLRTQSEVDGKPKFELNGIQGTQTMRQDGGTVWDVNADGVQSVGFENGERIVLDPNNQSISVYDENGIQRTNLDGKEYTREQLIVTSGGTFTLDSNASNTGGKTLSSSSSLVATASYPLTGLLSFSYAGVAEITVSDFYMSLYHTSRALSNTTPTVIPNGKAYMYLCTYTSSSASVLKNKRLIAYRSVSDATFDGDVTTSDKLSGTFSVAVSSGYHRIEVAMEATNGSSTGSTGVTAYWSLSSAKIVVESYMSRMFANGMMLSKSSNEYFMAMLDGDTMNVEAVSGTSGIKLYNGALQYKYNDSNWCNIPISLMFVRVTATGANTFTSSHKTFDGSSVSVTSSAEGVYDISIPPSWSSLVSIDSVNIQATGYGRYRGGSSNAVCWASVLSVTSTSVRIATSYNSNNEFDACGFYMEMKRI